MKISLALLVPLLVPATSATPPPAPSAGPCDTTVAFTKDVYVLGEPTYLTITGAPGTLVWLGLDMDPGPTFLPGFGSFHLGFSSFFKFTEVPYVLPPEGTMSVWWQCVINSPCENPTSGNDWFLQGVALDPVTTEFCATNWVVLNIEDLEGSCADRDGCTPGYWKNHVEAWAETGISPTDDFDTIFGVDYFTPDQTMLESLSTDDNWTLAAHASAALLNSLHPGTHYAISTSEVIRQMQLAAGADKATQEVIKNMFADLNQRGCPL